MIEVHHGRAFQTLLDTDSDFARHSVDGGGYRATMTVRISEITFCRVMIKTGHRLSGDRNV
jgi:hypothetical protein